MNKITPENLFDAFQELHVLVVGDVMLDQYQWGHVERISPEAPVPVVSVFKKESRLGGAANVALNCKALGAKVTLASVIGADAEGVALMDLLKANDIDSSLVRPSSERQTTSKTRILSRNQQMLRFDSEMQDALSLKDEHAFIDAVLRYLQIQKPHVLIFEDYDKGVLKENVIQKIIAHCKMLHIPVAVDPKRKNFFSYREATIFKPNLKEVREGLNILLEAIDDSSLEQAHRLLWDRLHHDISLFTLSDKGVYYRSGTAGATIPAHVRNIADVSGAGDTVIAVAAMVYALTGDTALMAEYANIAGGLVCEEVGVVPVNKERLATEIRRLATG